jgi:hypothetical protein
LTGSSRSTALEGDAGTRGLYFLHIPKTAGTAATRALDALFRPDEILDAGLLPEIVGRSGEELAGYRFIRGHFGVLPPERLGWGRLTTFTIVRPPVDQLLSLYAHIREHPAHYLHEDAQAQDLSTFLRNPRWLALATNVQARWLAISPSAAATAWDPPVPTDYPLRVQAAFDMWPHGLSDGRLRRAALTTLDQIEMVGVTAGLDDLLARVARAVGRGPVRAPGRANVSRHPVRSEDLSLVDRVHLARISAVDASVYQYAVRRVSDPGPGEAR